MVKIIPELKATTIDEVLKDVKAAVDLANADARLPINTVEIVFKINAAASGGVSFTVPIISHFTGKILGKVNHITETRIVFEPNPPQKAEKALPDLSESIKLIKAAIVKAGEITPDLRFKSAKAQIDFTISEEGSINFFFTGSEEIDGTHSIIISFGKDGKPQT
jgi:hypothetical protein